MKLTTQAGEPGGLFWICLEGGTAADVVAIMLMGSILDEIDAMGGRSLGKKRTPNHVSFLFSVQIRAAQK